MAKSGPRKVARDGGSDHCQKDNRQIGANLVADWLAERLGGRLA